MIYKNTAEIIGHVGRDVELNKTKNGSKNFTYKKNS